MVAVNTRPEDLTPTDAEIAEVADFFDIAFITRYTEPEAQQLARRLKAAGVPVVWDYDDDMIGSRRDRTDEESVALVSGCRAMIEIVDVVTTTNDRLAQRFVEEGAEHVIAVPNFLSRAAVEILPRPHEGIVLGYIGWVDHQADWETLDLEATARDLLEDFPELRVVSVGPLDFRLPEDRYERLDPVPYEELPRLIAGFDIGLAPLVDRFANHSRSNVKLKEYAIAGVPWLASPIGPYEHHGEHEGGRLVDDDQWYEEISRLAMDKRARRKLAKRGVKWAQSQTLANNVNAWRAAFDAAIEIAGERRAA
jgi:glycosyltransferase involved in cell wall biosynthesis